MEFHRVSAPDLGSSDGRLQPCIQFLGANLMEGVVHRYGRAIKSMTARLLGHGCYTLSFNRGMGGWDTLVASLSEPGFPLSYQQYDFSDDSGFNADLHYVLSFSAGLQREVVLLGLSHTGRLFRYDTKSEIAPTHFSLPQNGTLTPIALVMHKHVAWIIACKHYGQYKLLGADLWAGKLLFETALIPELGKSNHVEAMVLFTANDAVYSVSDMGTGYAWLSFKHEGKSVSHKRVGEVFLQRPVWVQPGSDGRWGLVGLSDRHSDGSGRADARYLAVVDLQTFSTVGQPLNLWDTGLGHGKSVQMAQHQVMVKMGGLDLYLLACEFGVGIFTISSDGKPVLLAKGSYASRPALIRTLSIQALVAGNRILAFVSEAFEVGDIDARDPDRTLRLQVLEFAIATNL